MDYLTFENYEHRSLSPGELHATRERTVISTLLGSCVSVCAFDPLARVVGMNHFLNSDAMMNASDPYYLNNAGHFGCSSMEMLLGMMLDLGASINSIKVKLFGGATMLQSPATNTGFFSIGRNNIDCISAYLKQRSIPVVSSNLGGHQGRYLYFFSDSHEVFMKFCGDTTQKIDSVPVPDLPSAAVCSVA